GLLARVRALRAARAVCALCALCAACALCAVSALCALPALAAAAPNLRVRGSSLVDGSGNGHVVTLRGVNRSGLEYACIDGWGFFDSPHPNRIDDAGMIAAMT